MTSISNLPTEIIRAIFSLADQQSQKALRLTNGHLASVGQRVLFETVSVLPNDESNDRLESILKRPDLVSYITKIYLNTFDPRDPRESQYGDGEDVAERLFSHVKDIPRLQSVVLRFHPECVEDDYDEAPQELYFRSAVMDQAASTLAAMPQLKNLALQDLQNVNETDKETVVNLNKILANLRSLRLNVANVNKGMSGSSDYDRENPQKFFSDLPTFWLKPTLSNLQHLTIYSSLYIGLFPKCDFRGLHFPQLKSLALGNYTFVHDSQLDWITSHAETLTELYLDDCPIVAQIAMDPEAVAQGKTYLTLEVFQPHKDLPSHCVYTTYNTRWADYFRAFKDKLPCLRHFRYGSAPNWWDDDTIPFESEGRIEIGFHRESYMVYREGLLPCEYMEEMHWEVPREDGETDYVVGEKLEPSKEDKDALRELCAKLRQGIRLDDLE